MAALKFFSSAYLNQHLQYLKKSKILSLEYIIFGDLNRKEINEVLRYQMSYLIKEKYILGLTNTFKTKPHLVTKNSNTIIRVNKSRVSGPH